STSASMNSMPSVAAAWGIGARPYIASQNGPVESVIASPSARRARGGFRTLLCTETRAMCGIRFPEGRDCAIALALAAGEALADQLAAVLDVAVGERLDRRVDAERALHAFHIDGVGGRVHADLVRDALAVGGREVHREPLDLGEEVEVGCERRDRAVEEH